VPTKKKTATRSAKPTVTATRPTVTPATVTPGVSKNVTAETKKTNDGALDLRAELSNEEVSESASESAMNAALKMEHDTRDPNLGHDVSALVDADPTRPVVVPGLMPAQETDPTLRRVVGRRERTAEVMEKIRKRPLVGNVHRPPGQARNDLIAEEKATSDEFRLAAAEAAQEDALDDLHVRRVDRLDDEGVARVRSAVRARRQARAEAIARMERVDRKADALASRRAQILAEGDSLAVAEPPYVVRARRNEESAEVAENQGVARDIPMTPEPYHERMLR
jgi:hypothetical protein